MDAKELREAAGDVIGYVAHVDKDAYEFWRANAIAFARHILATIPADDAEPVTGEWLSSLGLVFFKGEGTKADGWVIEMDDASHQIGYFGSELRLVDGGFEAEVRTRATDWSRGVGLNQPRTRGDVRRLLSALGIEVPKPCP